MAALSCCFFFPPVALVGTVPRSSTGAQITAAKVADFGQGGCPPGYSHITDLATCQAVAARLFPTVGFQGIVHPENPVAGCFTDTLHQRIYMPPFNYGVSVSVHTISSLSWWWTHPPRPAPLAPPAPHRTHPPSPWAIPHTDLAVRCSRTHTLSSCGLWHLWRPVA